MKPKLFVRIAATASAVALVLTAAHTQAADDLAFELDVTAAIDDGIQYLRSVGAFSSSNSSMRQARGLMLLALLEKRESADPNAAITGYSNASAGDKALAETAITRILEDTSFGVARGSFWAYYDGQNLMALSLYTTTGGPEVANGPGFTLRAAMDRLTDRAITAQTPQSDGNPSYRGMWGYGGNGNDSSTTQYAAAGLGAAKAYYISQGDPGGRLPGINTALANAGQAYTDNQRPDGGHGYRSSGYTSSYQQTASGLWVNLLGGNGLNTASAQGYLQWAVNNYNYQTIYAAYNSWSLSYYYMMWSSSKAYSLIASSGVAADPGNVDPDDLGVAPAAAIVLDRADFRLHNRDYVTDPDARVGGSAGKYQHYLDELQKARWYYDYAYSLMTQQDGSGRFTASSFYNNGATAINHGCWNTYACQSYALLVLERALGGVCLDSDGDGVCNDDIGDTPADNCPDTPNGPDGGTCLEGTVGSLCMLDSECGAGGLCDLQQTDTNGDGQGDVCEDPICDVDGDGSIDRNDISAIFAQRGNVASGPDDPMDANGDGVISVNDGRICVLECDNPNCEPNGGVGGVSSTPIAPEKAGKAKRGRRHWGAGQARR
jgi:hypothetical protein